MLGQIVYGINLPWRQSCRRCLLDFSKISCAIYNATSYRGGADNCKLHESVAVFSIFKRNRRQIMSSTQR